jgi:hypothetical protein
MPRDHSAFELSVNRKLWSIGVKPLHSQPSEKEGQQRGNRGEHKTGAVGSGETRLPDANLLPGPFKRPTQTNRHYQNTSAEHSDVADAKQSEPRLIGQ